MFARSLGLLAAALVLAAPALAQTPAALSPTAPRALYDYTDHLKDDDGQYVTRRSTLVYDPAAGTYTLTQTDADTGAVLGVQVSGAVSVGPTDEETAAAQRLVAEHPELAALIAGATGDVQIEGGFPLIREAGHACGPGSRCLQFDVYATTPGERRAERVRYVVVDLREQRVLFADFDAATDGNLAHPAARAQSRQADR